jgi:hypothetical protein
MARKILNRRELRAASDAADRREADAAEEEEVEDEEDEEDEDKDDDAEDSEDDDEADAEAEGDEDEAPKKKPKKAKKPPKEKAPAKPRKSRATKKSTRMRVVWAVFNNSNNRVATFDYPKKSDADALASKLTADKKSTHFVQPVKEPMEEKVEKSEKAK